MVTGCKCVIVPSDLYAIVWWNIYACLEFDKVDYRYLYLFVVGDCFYIKGCRIAWVAGVATRWKYGSANFAIVVHPVSIEGIFLWNNGS